MHGNSRNRAVTLGQTLERVLETERTRILAEREPVVTAKGDRQMCSVNADFLRDCAQAKAAFAEVRLNQVTCLQQPFGNALGVFAASRSTRRTRKHGHQGAFNVQ